MQNHRIAVLYGTAFWKGENLIETNDLSGDVSRIILNRAIPFIENSVKKEQPFFTTIWFHTPHLKKFYNAAMLQYYNDPPLIVVSQHCSIVEFFSVKIAAFPERNATIFTEKKNTIFTWSEKPE